MTLEELRSFEQTLTESKLQHTCVWWFRDTFKDMADILISVPNGGRRDVRAGRQMVYEGQVRGVSDLILLNCLDRPPLCIEMKVPKRKGRRAGTQSEDQERWQRSAERHGNIYVICHGLEEFIKAVCTHLGEDMDKHLTHALNKYPRYLQ